MTREDQRAVAPPAPPALAAADAPPVVADAPPSPAPAAEAATPAHGASPVRRRPALVITVLALLLVAACAASLALGRYAISLESLLALDETTTNVLFFMRLPRIAAAALIGAALAGAGCAYQGIFRNPMVSPDLLGASAGAGFGAAAGILFSLGSAGVELCAFVMGLLAVGISYFLSVSIGRSMRGVLVLVLSGMVIGNLFQAFTSAVKFVADPNSQLPEITFWLMGGLSAVRDSDLAWLLAALLLGGVGLFVLRWRINVMANGEEEARALGVEVKRVRLAVVACATLLTSASVAVAGMVGWVGLIVPHLARFLVGADQRVLLPASMLLGSTFLLVVDGLCRSVYTTEIPLSILTSIIGAPLFIYLIARSRKGGQ
ncbi:MAG: iron ABC transporter permease [Coriobacteriales bacterium]|jgi:iron complex transport system permease protein|nr:iron ABC transporter permease [Coriobacteriales bacterium]